MALTLTVETGAGLTTSNAYATAAEGDTYHEARLYATDWTGATEANKEAALVWATRLLDENIEYAGYKKTEDQALRWPRTSVLDVDGYAVNDDAIPAQIRDATIELARNLLAEDSTKKPDTLGFSKMSVGPLSLDIDKQDRDSIKVIPESVKTILGVFGRAKDTRQSTVKLARA